MCTSNRIFEVWLKNPGVLSHEVAMASPDAVIRKFAASLGEEYEIVDLRGVPIGMGFEWGPSGPPDVIRRIGAEPIFGLPRVAEKKSLFARLFGR